jgi:hypothetical protein
VIQFQENGSHTQRAADVSKACSNFRSFHQLPLHASAIETPHGAVSIAGEIGCGKSTLAAVFHRRGYRVLADDVCAVSLNGVGQPIVIPAYPQLNLCAGVLLQIGLAFIARHPWTSLANLAYAISLNFVLNRAGNVLHPPPSPIFNSGNLKIEIFFVVLILLTLLAAWQLTRWWVGR